jgi:hypothetical protein
MPRGRPRKNPIPSAATVELQNQVSESIINDNCPQSEVVTEEVKMTAPTNSNYLQVEGTSSATPVTMTWPQTIYSSPMKGSDLRDEKGLLKIPHHFKPTGFVNWRKMIPDEYIVLNRERYLKKSTPQDVDKLSEVEYAALKEKADEKDILIKLAGLKEVAQIRGYSEINSEPIRVEGNISVRCEITWIPNFETDFQEVKTTGLADATVDSVHGVAQRHLLAIAENRALARAIRNFLQIHTVSQDEVKFEQTDDYGEKPDAASGPQAAIINKLKAAKKNFEALQQFIMVSDKYRGTFTGPEVWESPTDISSSEASIILSQVFPDFLVK